MARPRRIEAPGAYYYVTCRGVEALFDVRECRLVFLEVLARVRRTYHLRVYAYVVMADHFHLVNRTDRANLSLAMRQLNGLLGRTLNPLLGREGPLFRGRFHSILFEPETYLAPLCGHVALNPVRSGLVSSPDRYFWSSFRTTAGLVLGDELLSLEWLSDWFGGELREAQAAFETYVATRLAEGDSPLEQRRQQVYLGSDAFIADVSRRAERRRKQPAHRVGLASLLDATGADRRTRNRQIRLAYDRHGYRLREIAAHLGLHVTTISKIVNTAPKS